MNIRSLMVFSLLIVPFFMKGENPSISLSTLPDTAISLTPFLKILTDETNHLSWEDAYLKYNNDEFESFKKYEFKSVLERGKFSYWLYLSIDYFSDTQEKGIIRGIGGDSLSFFQIRNKCLEDQGQAGYLTATPNNAEVAYWAHDIPINLGKGTTEILVRYRCFPTHHLANKNIKLLREDLVLQNKEKGILAYFIFFGLFLGIIVFMFFFTLFQYFQNGDKAFLFYAFFIASVFVYFWRFYALDNVYLRLLPDWMLATEYFTLWNIPMYITYSLFVKYFVGYEIKFEKIQQLINLFLGIILTYILIERTALYLFGMNWAYRIEKIGRPVFLFFGIVMIIRMILTGKRGSVNYILFGTLLMIGVVLLGDILTFDGIQSWYGYDISNSIAQLGILAGLLCFSLGLGAKSKQLEHQKKQAQLALQLQRKQAQQLKELNAFKNRFFTNITHEFRTPLTVIKGLAEQIRQRPNHQLDQRLEIIDRNTHNIQLLIDQLLDLSKLETGGISINNEKGDVINFLGYLTESFHSLAFGFKINLSFYSDTDSLVMDYDGEKLKQILTNLLMNALKFTPEYGKIIVAAELILEKDIPTFKRKANNLSVNELLPKQDYLKIEVKDSGCGIPADSLPHIFDRFFKLENKSSTIESSGIGLALVKDLVTLLDGAIVVNSQLKKGSSFTVFLPIVNKKEGAKISNDTKSKRPSFVKENEGKELIEQEPVEEDLPLLLIVEDNADVIYYIKSCVSEIYQVIEAQNGKVGLAMAIQEIPDLIISDIMMPEMDGYELGMALQQNTNTSHIPFLLLTAKASQESKKRGLEAGALAYLIKPFDKEELLTRLQNLLKWKGQLQEYLHLQGASALRSKKETPPSYAKEVAFLEQLDQQILLHLEDENFKAAHLSKKMAMSESQLYRKLKATTNQSIAKYIQNTRLQKAHQLLSTTDLQVGEVALKVGFKQVSHFSKVFQKHFNIRPSELSK